MKVLSLLFFSFFLTIQIHAQVEVIKFPHLDEYLTNEDSDKIKVVNFWATWCGPCVKELPFIDSLNYEYGERVEVLLVSLDFPDQLPRVERFLKVKNISSDVWLLDESDPNSFIDKVDNRWSGAIPLTILIGQNAKQRIFLEKELTKRELVEHLEKLLD